MVSTRQMTTTTTGPIEDSTAIPHTSRTTAGTSTAATSHSHNISTVIVKSSTSAAAAAVAATTHHSSPVQLLDLPVELLDKIFSYTGYKKIAQMREVSPYMNTVCSRILNSTFQKLQTQIFNRFQTVKAKMPRRESLRRNHPLACECDILETCHMRLSLLQMTFGKHIERSYCCFFPGGILDEVYSVLNYIRSTPTLTRPYKVTDELFDLSTMAMEYFKEHIEPHLPDIAYFNKNFISFTATSKKSTSYLPDSGSTSGRESSSSPSPPQSNMVLRKGIRKIKQGMKRYSNQLSVLRNELRTYKRKDTERSKQIGEQQKLIAEQQKNMLEYANRLDENDKKNEEISRKFSTMLQELNKCKTELQYWRSKSPATPVCNSCGQIIIPVPPEDMQALVNQGVKPEDMGLAGNGQDGNHVLTHNGCGTETNTTTTTTNGDLHILVCGATESIVAANELDKPLLSPIHIAPVAGVGSPRTGTGSAVSNKRKYDQMNDSPSTSFATAAAATSLAIGGPSSPSGGAGVTTQNNRNSSSDNNNKKIRRVQNKVRQQSNIISNMNNSSGNITKTRSK